MEWVQFRGRRAVQVETDQLRMTVTQEGGHIAELLHKDTAISPLWVPEWPSLGYGNDSSQTGPYRRK
jgi:hypothetical protein